MNVRKAIFPVAGRGTRFLPATKAQPKEMLPIVDKPTVQYGVEEAMDSGIESIIMVTGRNKRAMEDHFDIAYELEEELRKSGKTDLLKLVQDISGMVDIHYIRQKESRGLGHAILCARTFIDDEPFAVLLPDDLIVSDVPCLKQLINVYNEYKTTVIAIQKVPHEDVSKYGIVSCKQVDDKVYKINDLIEKPEPDKAPSDMAIIGRYIITPSIFEHIEKTEPGKAKEIQLTDALKSLMHNEAMYAYEFEGKRYDVGDRLGFLQANVEFALNRDDLREEFSKYLKEIAKTL
ncbi:MAG TPA: UTP--glucose-1-phosphate uridylyltransferase GalU [Clostridiaceae bacterium]|nr:UTP--glucose-1-phosphate uridylyltransferase GalU [Clostridiaceae bacterium]